MSEKNALRLIGGGEEDKEDDIICKQPGGNCPCPKNRRKQDKNTEKMQISCSEKNTRFWNDKRIKNANGKTFFTFLEKISKMFPKKR